MSEDTLLSVRGLCVEHGQLQALRDFDLDVREGEKVAVIGANGAGKSTLLRTLAGVLRPSRGTISLVGTDITTVPTHQRVEQGIAMVPEGRRLFPSLSLEENLLTGQYRRRPGAWDLDAIYALFDWMPDRRHQSSMQLSGGQQQAVAIGRALMANPRLLLVDELSLGLAPVVVQRIYEALAEIVRSGCAVLLVEQDVSQAMAVADHVHCLLEGRTVLSGAPSELALPDVEAAYFGIDSSPKAG
ncbi:MULTISPECIES: ABC transporter ATP-binding protein [Mumia]|uniref:ABC transporter ATP-binding protein n=1 Tax=Mumia TaxID=1546255 RepID=UPI0014235819|nr:MULTISPECIES: ABC transporter ATP-binding protein [unclassified Mumia]QMW65544.1 ABC transporter ATP-binding protein [Mumia sp. ZJ1417]